MIKKLLGLMAIIAALPGCVIYLDDDSDYLERHETLTIAAEGIRSLVVDNKAGNVVIVGEPGRESVEVQTTIRSQAAEDVAVNLKTDGGALIVQEDINFSAYHNNFPVVHLTIRAPQHLALELQDGSGNISIRGLQGDLQIDDGSGNVIVRGGHDVVLTDGSGNLEVAGATGHVDIKDGSGNLVVEDVAGTVTIRDGSGNIVVRRVGDLNIVSSGSGQVVTKDIGRAGSR